MSLSKDTITFHVYFPNISYNKKVPLDLDETLYSFVIEKMKDIFPTTNDFTLDTIVLDGKIIFKCCNNFKDTIYYMSMTDKKLKELNFRPGSNIEYYFI